MAVKVTVELTGPARVLTKKNEVSITVQENGTWRDMVAALAREVPALVGKAITEDKRGLIWPYILNLGGKHSIENLDEEAALKEGDQLSLLMEVC